MITKGQKMEPEGKRHAVGGDFYNGIEWLACWLLDHAEGEVVSEERLRAWAVEAWKASQKATKTVPDFTAKLAEATQRMIKEYQIRVDGLTEEQLAEAIKQAVVAGDFQRLLFVDGSQAVAYRPYRDVEDLRNELALTRGRLEQVKAWCDARRDGPNAIALRAVSDQLGGILNSKYGGGGEG